MKTRFLLLILVLMLPLVSRAQTVNSGSNGSDGAFHPKTTTVIDMADHPDGIYHYTSVQIPAGVTVTFKPNPRNTPVVWLVQGDCVIQGIVDLNGEGVGNTEAMRARRGGPGGFAGGTGGTIPTPGLGPGGGAVGGRAHRAYGNRFVLPLLGGSGGGGITGYGGAGGGGAILVAAGGIVEIDGVITANGGSAFQTDFGWRGTPGSAGAARLVASEIRGRGGISCVNGMWVSGEAEGWIRLDTPSMRFEGTLSGRFSSGFQPILFPVLGQGLHLSIQSVGGVAVSPNPTGLAATPDAVLSAGVPNPVPVVVRCVGVPLGTDIRVEARGGSGEVVAGVGKNTVGSEADSLATVSVNLPRGSGTLMARARLAVMAGANGAAGRSEGPGTTGASSSDLRLLDLPYSVTGLTTDGERIATVEVEAVAGGGSRTVYVTESGKRLPAPSDR